MLKHIFSITFFILLCLATSAQSDNFAIIRFSPGLGTYSSLPGPAAPDSVDPFIQHRYHFIFKAGHTFYNRFEGGLLYRFETSWGDVVPAYTAHSIGVYSRVYLFKNFKESFEAFENYPIHFKPYFEAEAALSNLSINERLFVGYAYSTNNWNSIYLSPAVGLDISFKDSPINFGFEFNYNWWIEGGKLYSMGSSIPTPNFEIAYYFQSNNK